MIDLAALWVNKKYRTAIIGVLVFLLGAFGLTVDDETRQKIEKAGDDSAVIIAPLTAPTGVTE